MTYILFDIGGTKTRVARSADCHTYDTPIKFETPVLYREGLNALFQSIDVLSGGKAIQGIAGGIRGPLNHEKTGISSEIKLTDWVGRNIVKDLTDR